MMENSFTLNPNFKQEPEIYLAGFSFFGDPFDTSNVWTEENHIGRTWKRLMNYLQQSGPAIKSMKSPSVFYEVHIFGQEFSSTGQFEVFIGYPNRSPKNVPIELSIKVLPATQYAIFTMEGDAILSDWSQTIDHWMAESGYGYSHPFSAQYYDARFQGLDRISESLLDVYIPVKKIAS